MQGSKKVAVVTGTSAGGIGFFTALAFAKAGFISYGTVRDPSKGEALLEEAKKRNLGDRVKIAILDVTKEETVEKGFKEILEREGHIDVLVNNSGIVLYGAFESMSAEDFHSVFNTNVLGAISCTQQVLPSMRERHSGTIINVSSGLGVFAFPLISTYCASKAALESVSQALAQEVKPFGIRVMVSQPSFTKTPILEVTHYGNRTLPEPNPYQQMIEATQAYNNSAKQNAQDPAEVAQHIVDAAISTDVDRFRIQHSESTAAFIAGILKDPTGLNIPPIPQKWS